MPEFPVYNKCNNNCLMCTNIDRNRCLSPAYFGLNRLYERMMKFRAQRYGSADDYRDSFGITGGEPTLSPHFIAVIRKINEVFPGMRIVCLTNGRRFAYADYAEEVLGLEGNLELAVSIHGPNAGIHDAITRTPGSFKQTIRGLDNIFRLRRPGQIVEIRIVIHGLNYKSLGRTAEFIRDNFPAASRLVFIFFEIEGQARKNLKLLRLTYSDFLPCFAELYRFISCFPEVRFYHFPLCAVPAQFFPYVWRTLSDSKVSFSGRCNGCWLKEFCLGVDKGYLKGIGDCEFRPPRHNFAVLRGVSWHHPILGIEGPLKTNADEKQEVGP